MRRLTLCAALALLSATAVRAEPPIGSRLGERTEKRAIGRESDSAMTAHEMARCMLDRKPKDVRAFLTETNEVENHRAAQKLSATMDCFAIGGDENAEAAIVMFSIDVMRGMLAEELIKVSHRSFEQLPALPAQRGYARRWFAVSERAGAVDEMATCTADVNPRAVLALIDTRPYSDQERAAIGAIAPVLGNCLVAGAKVDANRQALRAALADALFQRVANPQEIVPTAPDKPGEPNQ